MVGDNLGVEVEWDLCDRVTGAEAAEEGKSSILRGCSVLEDRSGKGVEGLDIIDERRREARAVNAADGDTVMGEVAGGG
jgi:hypothetical protein